MPEKNDKLQQSFAVEIASTSKLPQAQFRAKVKSALDEATNQFRERHHVRAVQVSGKADDGLFDLGSAWPWVIYLGGHVLGGLIYKAGEEAAKEIGKEGGESFYTMLKEALRKRNLTIGAPHDLRLFPDPDHPYASLPPAPPKLPKKPKSKREPTVARKTKRPKRR
jgi:hypothetical protein